MDRDEYEVKVNSCLDGQEITTLMPHFSVTTFRYTFLTPVQSPSDSAGNAVCKQNVSCTESKYFTS